MNKFLNIILLVFMSFIAACGSEEGSGVRDRIQQADTGSGFLFGFILFLIVIGIIVAVDRQEKLGDKDKIEELTAVEHLSKELGIKVFSIESISSIYKLLRDTLDTGMHQLWLDYFSKYSGANLD